MKNIDSQPQKKEHRLSHYLTNLVIILGLLGMAFAPDQNSAAEGEKLIHGDTGPDLQNSISDGIDRQFIDPPPPCAVFPYNQLSPAACKFLFRNGIDLTKTGH